jgi:hypothetical protein
VSRYISIFGNESLKGQLHKAYHYSKLAKQVTDALGLQHTDLHGESLMKIGYTSPDYNERISSFLDCYSRDKFTDKVIKFPNMELLILN